MTYLFNCRFIRRQVNVTRGSKGATYSFIVYCIRSTWNKENDEHCDFCFLECSRDVWIVYGVHTEKWLLLASRWIMQFIAVFHAHVNWARLCLTSCDLLIFRNRISANGIFLQDPIGKRGQFHNIQFSVERYEHQMCSHYLHTKVRLNVVIFKEKNLVMCP